MEYSFKLIEPVEDNSKELTKLNNVKDAIFLAWSLPKKRL